ncbi:hypothetical protein B0H13DRAFT_2097350 [Mycena leptocephala]|nr:hypothetical protein B0H13DRAFT_2097350 [Mycena leptocephala]
MLPVELVELIIYNAWGCLSTSSHRHGFSMTQWMLVNCDWLIIVISVVFRDLWIVTPAHMNYIHSWLEPRSSRTTFIFQLAGIPDVQEHLCQMCRSLTISVYHTDPSWYASHCRQLLKYASTTSSPERLVNRYDNGAYAVPSTYVFAFARTFTPRATTLHFVLIDCNATYGEWDTTDYYAYYMTEFPPRAIDAPPPVFVRLPRTETWGLTGTDTLPASVTCIARQKMKAEAAQAALVAKTTAHSEIPVVTVKKRRNPIWCLLKRVFTEGK